MSQMKQRFLPLFAAAAFAVLSLGFVADRASAQAYPSTTPVYIPTAQKAVATLTAIGTYEFNTNGLGAVTVRVVKGGSATYTGAIQCTNDNSNWTTLQALPVAGGAVVTSVTTSGFWVVNTSGCTKVRLNATAVGGTGGLTVQMAGSPAASPLQAVQLAAGAAILGSVAIDQTTPGTTNAVQAITGTTGGGSMAKMLSAATTNSTSIKASAGTLYLVTAANTNAATAYLKFYNTAGAPTCNSDTVQMTFTLIQNVPRTIEIPFGAAFSNGIGLCITGAAADNDNTAATTGIVTSIVYK